MVPTEKYEGASMLKIFPSIEHVKLGLTMTSRGHLVNCCYIKIFFWKISISKQAEIAEIAESD